MKDFFGHDKVALSIERLKSMEPTGGYYLAFSGGKDSICIKQLAIEAEVKFDAHYSVTTIDPPELVRYIKQYHKDVKWEFQPKPFLMRMVEKGFPQRQRRWCCAEYKEVGGTGRTVVTGIRWAESANRKKRKVSENHYAKKSDECKGVFSKKLLNPIIDWLDEDVWAFIWDRKLPYPSLYDEGFERLGCLFCPMAGKDRKEMAKRYPGFARAFRSAFEKLYVAKQGKWKNLNRWANGSEMFDWWINETRTGYNPAQRSFDFGD